MFAAGNALPGATRGDLWGRTVVSGGAGVDGTPGFQAIRGQVARKALRYVCVGSFRPQPFSVITLRAVASVLVRAAFNPHWITPCT